MECQLHEVQHMLFALDKLGSSLGQIEIFITL